MTVLLQLRDAHKSFGDQHLLEGAEFAITDQHNVGLIGRNGAGKSTLCRILLGLEELDAGQVVRHPRLRLGYLRQHDPFEPGETVRDFLMRDSSQPDWRCGEVAWEFELKDAQLGRPVHELSGGWQTRVKLASLLLHDPNLLILDEPTNFLDLRTQMLFEHFLRSFKGACLVVSHDRAFLKATCRQTVSISRGQLTMYAGDVDAFLAFQDERREHDRRVNSATLTKRKQLDTFINKNRANANTASQARNKAKQLERLELLDVEGDESRVAIRVPEVESRRGPALRCHDLAIGYDDLEVASGIAVEIEHGERVAVVGDNGQGKTTFLRTISESLPTLSGEIRWGYGCQLGVYAQHVYVSLPDHQTVREYLEYHAAAGVKAQTVLDVAGSFLFRGPLVDKQIKVLSGGERARLCLAGLLLGEGNVLVLDEPGNHLDVETVDALADALGNYRGTVIFTSHGRHFMNRVTTAVVEVRDGRVTAYPGDYNTYVYRVEKEIDEGTRPADAPKRATDAATDGVRGDGVGEVSGLRVSGREEHRRQKRVNALERKIVRLDESRRAIDKQLLTTTEAADAERLHVEQATVVAEIKTTEEQWFELQEEGD